MVCCLHVPFHFFSPCPHRRHRHYHSRHESPPATAPMLRSGKVSGRLEFFPQLGLAPFPYYRYCFSCSPHSRMSVGVGTISHRPKPCSSINIRISAQTNRNPAPPPRVGEERIIDSLLVSPPAIFNFVLAFYILRRRARQSGGSGHWFEIPAGKDAPKYIN